MADFFKLRISLLTSTLQILSEVIIWAEFFKHECMVLDYKAIFVRIIRSLLPP